MSAASALLASRADDDVPPRVGRGTLFLSRGAVTMIKSIGANDPARAVVEAARMFDIISPTRHLSPVRLVVRIGDASAQFDATWPADAATGTLDLVRRGYFSRTLVRAENGELTQPVRNLLERIADLIIGPASVGAR